MSEPRPEAADEARREQIWQSLLAWYSRNARDLPWRATHDPYAVLVSEVMLQQTQVERVVPKYHEFMARFPNLVALAEAPTGDVIRAWAPLGYNQRAVRLQRTARRVNERFDGALPSTVDGLLALEGIGRYTAGAVSCFAFGQPVAMVDTNIRRVLWRVFRGVEPRAGESGQHVKNEVLTLAEWALPPVEAYSWQQALMDLGATICTSRRPSCHMCPLATHCLAFSESARGTLLSPDESPMGPRTATPSDTTEPRRRRVAESPVTYTPSAEHLRRSPRPFNTTARYYRGRILHVLRELAPGDTLPLAEIGPRIKSDWHTHDVPWLATLAQRLVRDGLAVLQEDSSAGDSSARLRIRLP